MKRDDIITAVGLIDDALIAETASVRKKHKQRAMRMMIAVAACVAVTLSGIWVYSKTHLPMLDITFTHHLSGGGSVMCYDISAHDETNPWDTKMPIRRLPVYQNAVTDENWQVTGGLSEKEMTNLAEKAADTLGFTVENVEKEQYVGKLKFTTDRADIIVDPYGTVDIFFGRWGDWDAAGHIPLPDIYNFRHDADFADAEKTLLYLTETYAELLDFSQPVPYLTSSFSYAGERRYEYRVYEGAGTAAERILNYACKTAYFKCDDNGNLYAISIKNALAAAKKLGNYPVISSSEAYALLLEGYYVDSHLKENPVNKDTVIHKQGLIYRATMDDATILPYYVFYVEDPTTYYGVAEGLISYNTYHVPAIDRKYIRSLPLWDGTTNK